MNVIFELGGLFLVSLIAATLFPAGSEVLLLGLAHNGDYAFGLLLFVASLGNVLGACLNYVLGAYLIHFQDRKWFPMKKKTVDRFTAFYKKWGVWSLLLAWVPIIGDPLTFLGGMFRARFWLFLLMVSVGKVGRYALLLWLI